MPDKPRMISGYSSVVLDTLRILAALMVVFHHLQQHFLFSIESGKIIENLAHSAVVVFFVLSGYVIAFTTTVKNRGGLQYLIARFSRLYSIVLPALVITAICQFIVSLNSPRLYAFYTRGASWPRYLLSLSFLNEIWFFSAAPPMNGPLWSLSFEFSFYMIFGLWFYRKPGFKYMLLPLLVCIVVGPKILSMMPIWLVGYWAYKIKRPLINDVNSYFFVYTSFILAGLMIAYLPSIPFELGRPPLFLAGRFISDFIIGCFIGLALWLLPQSDKKINQTKSVRWFRTLADLTFPLYILHYPLLVLFDAIFNYKVNDMFQLWLPCLFIVFFAVIFGLILEKQRFVWNKWFTYLFNYIKIKLNI
ncbi:acyltransferase family protein [Mucilaginibacter sp. UYCu711]|uniref:acyltransferase family protein n=1 Tax=Mucilaginibacter sp. UYCu711 TaxID=3156339 RepID=UPI003D24A1E9